MSFNKEYSLDNNFSLLQNEDNDDTPKYTFIDLSTNSSHKNLNSFITIPKFKKFLNQSRTYQCRFEHFESPISKAHSFSYQIFLIPFPNDLSVKIEFSPKEEQIKNNSITIQLSVYSSVKETFTQITNRTFIVTKENMYLENNYIVYNKNLIVNKMIFPFLLRVRLFQGKKNKPCDEKIGIVNEGNTCYLNTILQNMSNIPYIRKILYDIDSSNDKFILNLQKIFFRLQNSKSPIKISTELRENNFLSAIIPALKEENKIQQDAQEIFSYIFDYLSKNNSLLSELCEGKLKIEIKCDEINHVSSNEENFLFLSLDCNINIPTTNTEGELTLYDCIEHFLSVETLEGDNAYESEIDHQKHKAIKTTYFKKLPPILFFHLKRFNIDQTKSSQKVIYKEILDMTNYYTADSHDVHYQLYSVTIHEGEIDNGHYTIYIKDFINNQWILYNDNLVYYISNENEVYKDNYGGYLNDFTIQSKGEIFPFLTQNNRTAYILCYIATSKINELFNQCKDVTVSKELEDRIYKIPNQMSITHFLYKKDKCKMQIDEKIDNIVEEGIKETTNKIISEQNTTIKEKYYQYSIPMMSNQRFNHDILTIFDISVPCSKQFFAKDIIQQLKEKYTEFNMNFSNCIENLKFVLVNCFNVLIDVLHPEDTFFDLKEYLLKNKDTYSPNIYLYSFIDNHCDMNKPLYAIHDFSLVSELPFFVTSPSLLIEILNEDEEVFEFISNSSEIKKCHLMSELQKEVFNKESLLYDPNKILYRLLIIH